MSLRFTVGLLGPTDEVASNWADGVRVSLYQRAANGQQQLVLGPDAAKSFIQPLYFDTHFLAAQHVPLLENGSSRHQHPGPGSLRSGT
jgi:hypothetical protein